MAVADTRSPADRAYERFVALLETRALLTQGERTLTEADTRAKLIDPLFKTVLGWSEAEIRREEPVAKGYVGYVLGSEYSHILILQAKTCYKVIRSQPYTTYRPPIRFERAAIHASSSR